MLTLNSIVHPTDFSDASADAFTHALRIAITAKAELHILHVATADEDWMSFPHVPETLARWGFLDAGERAAAIQSKLGITIRKVELPPQSPVAGIQEFLDKHSADLIVLGTEGRHGAARWLHGTVAEKLARHARTPTLFVPIHRRGFIDHARGNVTLRRVLIPVDREPGPAAAIGAIMAFAHAIGGDAVEERLLHVGRNPPKVPRQGAPQQTIPVATRDGDVVETIVETATGWQADLIGMPTAGHDGFLDALRGSTTERVLRQAPCAVLAVPVH